MSDVEGRLRRVIAAHLDVEPDRLLPDSHLGDNLGIDSLDAVELTMVLEDEFDIDLPDEVVADVRTYGQVVAMVGHRVELRAARL
ncbi:MAG: acyl carrier protein [Acidimicrobiales bacterium]